MILITGASSGIGRSCAWEFAAQGHDLFLIARRTDRLAMLKSEIEIKYPDRVVEILAFDLTRHDALDTWFRENPDLVHRVLAVVNNAGLASTLKSFGDMEGSDYDIMFETNVHAVFRMIKRMLPSFLSQGRGHFIQIGSVAGQWFYPNGNLYAASKAAVYSMGQSLRIDLLGKPIRVTEIAPGMVETEFSEVRLQDRDKAKAVYQGMTPLTPDDIARSVVWCFQQPAHVNIQELVIFPVDQASPNHLHRRSPL